MRLNQRVLTNYEDALDGSRDLCRRDGRGRCDSVQGTSKVIGVVGDHQDMADVTRTQSHHQSGLTWCR